MGTVHVLLFQAQLLLGTTPRVSVFAIWPALLKKERAHQVYILLWRLPNSFLYLINWRVISEENGPIT